ncbi:MAG: hypothetical protein RBS35_06410 [Azonexus sp.]|jgi:hypothetical protein|nr:hypothetical protein [Azonexus sp.]
MPRPDPACLPEPDFDSGLVQAVCAALRAQVEKLGLSIGDEPDWPRLEISEQRDPFSQEVSRVGHWRGTRSGMLSCSPDGRVFAEYQVLLPLPGDDTRYVESVQVWGRLPDLRGEAVIGAFVTL